MGITSRDAEFTFVTTLRVRYSETDKMGIVFNSNYLSWFEVARTEYCRMFGMTYREWEARGYGLPVAEAHCRYKAPARYDDLIDLYCMAPKEKVLPHSIVFEYRIKKQGEGLLAFGWTKHAFVGADGKIISKDNEFQEWLLKMMTKQEGA